MKLKKQQKRKDRLAYKMAGYESIMRTGNNKQQKAANKPGSMKYNGN